MSLLVKLAEEFDLTTNEVRSLINTAPERYKVHEITKRNGRGTRLIAQPTATIKTLQKWVISNILMDLPIHEVAKAYRNKTSIKDHAILHAHNKYLLKMDFKDFFYSLTELDFRGHIHKYKPELLDDLDFYTKILFWKMPTARRVLRLSIGAPSSPFISNALMYEFDTILYKYCTDHGITYSRYADDLALSTNDSKQLDAALATVKSICKTIIYPRLTINDEKTVFTSKKYNRTLTGLVLTNNGEVSLGREKKRLIRAMAHRYKENKLDTEDVQKLKGLLAFAVSIEPNFLSSIRRMLGNEQFLKLTRS